jgi:hypothetical protein
MHIHAWKKYLPVIKILLKRSASTEQVISLDRIDFERVAKSHKPLCSFSIELTKGRISPLSPPITAKELVDLLMDDPVTKEIIRHNHYALSLSSKFQLVIKNLRPVEVAAEPAQEIATEEQISVESEEKEEKEIEG